MTNETCANCGRTEDTHFGIMRYCYEAEFEDYQNLEPRFKPQSQARQTKPLKAQFRLGNNPYGEDISNKDKTAEKIHSQDKLNALASPDALLGSKDDFVLSGKRFNVKNKLAFYYHEEDVREFIRRLKEYVYETWPLPYDKADRLKKLIDTLAGDELSK